MRCRTSRPAAVGGALLPAVGDPLPINGQSGRATAVGPATDEPRDGAGVGSRHAAGFGMVYAREGTRWGKAVKASEKDPG
jgi:hypothetical protein